MCAQGRASDGFFALLGGAVDLTVDEVDLGSGAAVRLPGPTAISRLGHHDLGGFVSLLFANVHEPFTATAAEPCLLLYATAERTHALLQRCPMLRHELELAADVIHRRQARDVAVAAAVHGALSARIADLTRRLAEAEATAAAP